MSTRLPSSSRRSRLALVRRGAALTLGLLVTAGVIAACSDDKKTAPSTTFTPSLPGARAQLEADTGSSWLVELDPTWGTLRFAMPRGRATPLVAKGVTREQAVATFVEHYDSVFHLGGAGLVATQTSLDPAGGAHVTFAEAMNGVVVHGGQITVHLDASGSIAFINGLWIPPGSLGNTTPKLAAKDAISIVESDMVQRIRGFSPATELAQRARLELDATIDGKPRLVYTVRITGPLASQHVLVDAVSGAILRRENQRTTVDARGKGIAYYATNANHDANDVKPFQAEMSGGGDAGGASDAGGATTYSMHAPKAGSASELTVYDFNQYTPTFDPNAQFVVVSTPDSTAWDTAGNGPGAAVDAYVTMAKVDKFYASAFGRTSYDNQGSKVDVVVHQWDLRWQQDPDGGAYSIGSASPYMCNAFFDPGGLYMAFGDGDWRAGIGPIGGWPPAGDGGAPPPAGNPGTCYPLAAALDVAAHEYTHAIVHAELGLDFANEAGSMDESFADIFGDLAEHSDHPDDGLNMEVGEQGWIAPGSSPIRSAANPSLGLEKCTQFDATLTNPVATVDEPDNYSKLVPSPVSDVGDYGGRHCNSTIATHAFYLMTLGGQNRTSQVTVKNPLGWSDAQRLWYAVLTQSKMSSTATFMDEAKASLAQAKTLGMRLEPVACAWVATGVLDNAFARDNFGILCECPSGDGGAAQDPATFACCPEGDPDAADAAAVQCCKPCGEAGVDASAAPVIVDGGSPDVALFDSCTGRADGVYCSQLQSFSAIVCKGGAIAGGQQCAANQTCAGPNGPGATVQCQ